MCCHACPGYELCKTRNSLKQDDCCPKCPYYTACMEEALEEEEEKLPRSHAVR